MKKGLLFIVVLTLVMSTGCAEQSTEKIGQMEEKIIELEQQIAILKSESIDYLLRIGELEREVSKKAMLFPTEGSGYSKSGDFLVSIINIEEYLDGCKVYLKIGNPNNALYSGYTINAKYGTKPNFSDSNFAYGEWESSLKNKEIRVSSDLERGSWSNVDIILPSIDIKDFSYLEVEVITDNTSLYTK